MTDIRRFSCQLAFPLLCVLAGAVLAGYHNSSLLSIIPLAILTLVTFLKLEYAIYLLFLGLPFSFRYILPMEAELQMPTEPLLGLIVLAYFLRRGLGWFARLLGKEEVSQAPVERFPFWWPLLAFAVSQVLSVATSAHIYISAKGVIRALTYMGLSFAVYDVIRSRRQLTNLFGIAFLSGLLAVVWTTLVLIGNLHLWQWRAAYSGTPFTNYAVYGSFAGVFFLILLARTVHDRESYDRVLWNSLLIAFGVGLAFCFSRGAWLSILVGLAFLFFYRSEGNQSKKLIAVAAFGFVLLLLLSIPGVFDQVLERIETMFNTRFASNRVRLLRWGAALGMFLQRPITGVGYGAFALIYQGRFDLQGETVQYQMGAHSEYLQTLAETGLLGFAAWMGLILSFFWYGIRQLPRVQSSTGRSMTIGLMAAELSLLFHFFFVSILDADKIGIPFWAIYGLLPAIVHIFREPSEHG